MAQVNGAVVTLFPDQVTVAVVDDVLVLELIPLEERRLCCPNRVAGGVGAEFQ